MKNLLNLYTEELRERPVPYGFPFLIGAFLATIAVTLGLGLWTEHKLSAMEAEQQRLAEQQQALNGSIASLEAQRPKQERIEAMERENARLTQAIAQRERLLAVLGGYVGQPVIGFSTALRGLAAAHGQGVWLTHIHLARPMSGWGEKARVDASIEVALSGRMHKGQQLASYLDALAATEVFGELHFNSMQAQLEEKGKENATGSAPVAGENKIISFTLSTTHPVGNEKQ